MDSQNGGGKSLIGTIKIAVLPIAKVFTVSFLEFLLAYFKLLPANGRKLLNGLVFSLLLPCLIFSQLGQAITLEKMIEWWFIPFNVVLATISGSLIGLLVVSIVRPPYPFFKFTIIQIGIGLIHANHGEGIKQFLRDSLCSTNVEVIQHGACLGLGLAALGTADEDIYDDVTIVLYTDSVVCGFLFEPCTYILSEAVNFVRNQLRQHGDVQLVRHLEEQLWSDVHKIMSTSSLLIWAMHLYALRGQIGKVCLVQKENFVYELGQAFATIGIVSLGVWMSSLLSA
ncbi:hypothetical protein ACSBR1_014352 [Camellia fascicularis]